MMIGRTTYIERAQGILALIEALRGEAGVNEAITQAHERFVDAEVNPELRRFGEVLTLARRQALLQNQLDEDREKLHHGNLNHEQRVETGHHYEMMRHQACTYNHLLRGLIESSSQYFSRLELLDWLAAASQGRRQWAMSEMTGAMSEIALHAALQGLRELRGLRYAQVEEDLAGYDFVALWQGDLLTIDAKTGYYRPLTERKHGHRHLEISVPREVIHELRVTRRGLDLLRREVQQALCMRDVVRRHAERHSNRWHRAHGHAV